MTAAGIQRAIFLVQVAAAAAIAWYLARRHGMVWSWSIATGVAAGFVVHALIIALEFLVAGIKASTPPPLYRIGWFRGIACYLGEVAASIRTFTFAQPWLAGRKMAGQRIAYTKATPVLLLHGFFCNRAIWRPMARKLAAAGHATSAINLEPVYGSIDEYAPLIDHAVRRLQQRTGAQKVVLLCHSMGGLAARAYLRAYGDQSIAKIITIATPHRGTYLARFGHGKNARQMRLGSAWLEDLAAAETPQRRALFVVLLSHHDNIVSPQMNQTIEGAPTHEFSGIGHVAMLYDAQVQNLVVRTIERG
jgi:triacylglycerol lipase